MRKKVARVLSGQARIASIMIVVSCTAGTAPERETFDLRSDPPPSGRNRPFESVAHAAESVDATPTTCDAGSLMPENPAHISLRFQRVPEVIVTMLSGKEFPYPYSIVQEDEATTVVLYLPQGVEMDIAVTPVGDEGQPLADPLHVTVEPEAKLGTSELELGSTQSIIRFTADAQDTLNAGDTFLQGPVTTEFIDGRLREVFQGVYTATEDGVLEVSWTGTAQVYSFLDGPPVLRTEPFVVAIKAGQKLGLYPEVYAQVEFVRVRLRDPSCDPSSP